MGKAKWFAAGVLAWAFLRGDIDVWIWNPLAESQAKGGDNIIDFPHKKF